MRFNLIIGEFNLIILRGNDHIENCYMKKFYSHL